MVENSWLDSWVRANGCSACQEQVEHNCGRELLGQVWPAGLSSAGHRLTQGEGSLPGSDPPRQQGQNFLSYFTTTRAPQRSCSEGCQGCLWMWDEPGQVEQPQVQPQWSGAVSSCESLDRMIMLCAKEVHWDFIRFLFLSSWFSLLLSITESDWFTCG